MNLFTGTGSRARQRIMLPVLLCFIATPGFGQPLATPSTQEVRVRIDRPARQILIAGLDPAALNKVDQAKSAAPWPALCPITVREDPDRTTEPMIGSYHVEGSTLRFVARYPLDQPHYRVFVDAKLRNSRDPGRLAIDVDSREPARAPQRVTIVTGLYPSAPVLPENLLRFYIHFSAPMSRGEAYRHIHLLDAAGKPVADPFLELDEELWSSDGCRFTLLFDPGRIKRGLKPREEVGPALEQGRRYSLLIDRGWTDATGRPLDREFRRQFEVGPPDHTSPTPGDWVVQTPAANTRDPLAIQFPEPLDNALARRLITVENAQARPVPGQAALASAETRWSFTPSVPWKAGAYRLMIGTELEDVAGNAVNRPFEVDAVGPISRRIESEKVALPFLIKPSSR